MGSIIAINTLSFINSSIFMIYYNTLASHFKKKSQETQAAQLLYYKHLNKKYTKKDNC